MPPPNKHSRAHDAAFPSSQKASETSIYTQQHIQLVFVYFLITLELRSKEKFARGGLLY